MVIFVRKRKLTGVPILASLIALAGVATAQQPASSTQVDSSGFRHSSAEDCSQRPESEHCRRKLDVDAGGGGVNLGYQQTHVTLLADPPNGFGNVLLELGGVYGSGDDLTLTGGAVGFGFRGGIGGKLPGAEGGSWHGLGVDFTFRYSYTSVEFGSGSSESHLVDFGGTVGYQFYTFGAMDRATFKQSGFGLSLGYRLGMLQQFAEVETDPEFSHGPSLTLSRPSYNAGTTALNQFFLTVMVLPLEDFFLATLSLGLTASLSGNDAATGKPGPAQCLSHAECGPGGQCQAGQCMGPVGGYGSAQPGGPGNVSPSAGSQGAPGPDGSGLPPAALPEADF